MEKIKRTLSETAYWMLAAAALGLAGLSSLLAAAAVKTRCTDSRSCPAENAESAAE